MPHVTALRPRLARAPRTALAPRRGSGSDAWRTLLLAVAVLPTLAACDRLPGRVSARATQTAVAAAATPRPRPTADRTIARTITADGRLVAVAEAQALSFPSAGTVVEVAAVAGQTVHPDDVLARIDTLALDLALADARAALRQAETTVTRLQAGDQIETARIQVEQAKNHLWGVQTQRDTICGRVEAAQKLPSAAKAAAPGQSECDNSQAGVQAAEQGVALAEAALRSAEASAPRDLAVARAQLERARLALRQAEDRRARATLTAPFTGTITAVSIVPGVDVAPGVPAITLSPDSALQFVTTNLGERYIADVMPGARATVTLTAFPDRPLEAMVSRIAPQGAEDPSGTVVFAVYLEMKPTGVETRAGMTGRVEIEAVAPGTMEETR